MTSRLFSAILEAMDSLNSQISKNYPYLSKLRMPIILFLVAILSGIIGYLIGVRADKNSKSQLISQQTSPTLSPTIFPNTISTGGGSYTITTTIPDQMKFVSQKLGISFLYDGATGVPPTLTKEEGDKVFIYADYQYTGFDYHQGQFLQVFKKDPKITLVEAIKQQLLVGISEQDCYVMSEDDTKQFLGSLPYPSGFNVAIISYPGVKGHDGTSQDVIHNAAMKCPIPYAITTGGIKYFLLDTAHPDKFIFVSSGQQPFGGTELPVKTLKILQ